MKEFFVIWLTANSYRLLERWFFCNNESKQVCRFMLDGYKNVIWVFCEEIDGLRFSLSGSLDVAGLQYRWKTYFDSLDISKGSFARCMETAMTAVWDQIKDSMTYQLSGLQDYAIGNIPEYKPQFVISVYDKNLCR